MLDPAAFLRLALARGLVLRLFTEAYEPSAGDRPAEPAGGGYAPQELPAGLWDVDGDTAHAPECTFTLGPGCGKVRGWWLSDADGNLVAGERFRDGNDKPLTREPKVAGCRLTVAPKLRLREEA